MWINTVSGLMIKSDYLNKMEVKEGLAIRGDDFAFHSIPCIFFISLGLSTIKLNHFFFIKVWKLGINLIFVLRHKSESPCKVKVTRLHSNSLSLTLYRMYGRIQSKFLL